MKLLSAALLAASLTIGLAGTAKAGLATGDVYNFTVWSGTYNSLGINGNADIADTPAMAQASVSFTYTGPIDFANTASQTSPNLASAFFGTSPAITHYHDISGQFTTLSDFLNNDALSTKGTTGSALVTFMQITGTYAASPGTTVSVTHDDGASLYTGTNNTLLIDSAAFTSKATNTATLPATGPSGDKFTLDYVEANGAPSILQVATSLPVPEPASFTLLGTGLIGLGLVLRRRRRV